MTPVDGPVAPQPFRDTDYRDPSTGLYWEDLDCVDCLRLWNQRYAARRRRHVEELLAWCAEHPECVGDLDVDPLIDRLERMAQNVPRRE